MTGRYLPTTRAPILAGKLLVQGCRKLYSQVFNTHTLIHKDRIKLLAVYIIQMYTLENIYQLNLYIGIGYILPKIGEYMSIEGCL